MIKSKLCDFEMCLKVMYDLLLTDIDECREETANCSQNATCKDTDGAYTCTCNRGFHGDGKICTSIFDW